MSYISSINFKKSTSFQVFHNANIRPSYAIGGEIECTLKGYEAEALKNELIAEAKKTYETTVKQKFQAKSYEWSAVCNIKPETTMQDLENLAKFLEEKYKFQCYQIAIHRDEGHINEQGEKVINHHAHLEFITLDKDTGKSLSRLITPMKLRQMQTEVAEILQMERGVDKRISGAKRVEPRLFAKMKEEERKNQEALKLEIAQNKKEIESTNKLLEEYDELLEKEQQKTKDLIASNNELKEKIATKESNEKNRNAEIERLKKEKEEQELKTKKELSNLRLELEKEQQKSKDLIAENNELKSESNEAELMDLQEKVLKLDRNELKNEKWIIALAYCEQEIGHHGYVVDAIPDMVKYQKEAWKNKDSIKQDYLNKAKIMINNSIDKWKKTIASNAKTIVRQR